MSWAQILDTHVDRHSRDLKACMRVALAELGSLANGGGGILEVY